MTRPQKLDNSLTAQRRKAATKQTASIVNHKASEYTGNGRAPQIQPSNDALGSSLPQVTVSFDPSALLTVF